MPRPLLLSAALVCLAATHVASARPGWPPAEPFTTPAGRLATVAGEADAPDEAIVVVLLRDWTVRFDEQGRSETVYWQIYQVRNEAAVDGWGLSQARWSPWFMERPEIRARVVDTDGTEHWLDGSGVVESAVDQDDPTMFDDDRMLRTPLPGMEVGAVVEEVIVQRETEPFSPAGSVTRLPIQSWVHTSLARVRVEAPDGLPLTWTVEGLDVEPKKTRGRGLHGFEVQVEEVPRFEWFAEALPPDRSPIPYVEFCTGRAWNEVANHYLERIRPQLFAGGLEELVVEVSAAGPEREAMVEAAWRMARDRFRYTGLEFGHNSIVPYAPAESLRRGYGDCKDKAALMVALLAEVGIEAHVALLNAGFGADVNPDMPGMDRFTHAIVFVPGERELWLDPTAQYQPFGELPLADRGRWALIAAEHTDVLVQTPQQASAETLYVEERYLDLPGEGGARMREVTTARGWIAGALRADYRDVDRTALEEHLGEYVGAVYEAQELASWELCDVGDPDQPFRMEVAADEAMVGHASGVDASLAISLGPLLSWLPEVLVLPPGEDEPPLEAREHPVVLARHRAEVQYHVTFAPGYVVRPLPASSEQRFGDLVLVQSFDPIGDDRIEVRYALDTGDGVIPPADAARLREALVELQRADDRITWDMEGEVHLANARYAEALQTYDALIEARPDVALYRSLRATVLLAAGLGEAARAAALEATEVEPASASAWRYVGFVRMHDLHGRELSWPFDREGAIEALERAVVCDPEDTAVLQNLAVVLEHDERGVRYADGADLSRAAELYRQRRDDLGLHDLDANLMAVLFHLGEFDELRELAGPPPHVPEVSGLLFAALALEQGADAAVAEANRQTIAGGNAPLALLEAGQLLTRERHYAAAASLMRGAAGGFSNPVEIRQKAATIGAMHPYEQVLEDVDGPLRGMLDLFVVTFDPAFRMEDLEQVFARELIGDEDEWTRGLEEGVTQGLASFRALLRGSDMEHELLLDMLTSSMECEPDGDDRAGYRIDCRFEYGQPLPPYYVVKQRGRYVVRAVGTLDALLGDEAFARVRRGDLAGARRWLDWAAQDEDINPEAPPYTISPFMGLWHGQEEPDRDRVRLAAAALMPPLHVDQAIPVLEQAAGELGDERERLHVRRALLGAYETADMHEQALALAEELAGSSPTARTPRYARARALVLLGRVDEAWAAAEAMGQELDDPEAGLVARMMVAEKTDDAELVVAVGREIIAGGKARAGVFNQVAWYLLFLPGADIEEAVEAAVQANTGKEAPSDARLHTLAVVLAEAGRPAEAQEVMLLAVEQMDGADTIEPHWWYVPARNAEELGLRELARELYGRVQAEGGDHDTLELARRRLAGLDAGP